MLHHHWNRQPTHEAETPYKLQPTKVSLLDTTARGTFEHQLASALLTISHGYTLTLILDPRTDAIERRLY